MGSSTALAGHSILVVEDEAMIAFDLKELFEAHGADVHVAVSPYDALTLLDALVLSAAVVDFGSTDRGGGKLCETLRAYEIPFMYYTGYDDVEERRLKVPVITKPAGADILIEALLQLLLKPCCRRSGEGGRPIVPASSSTQPQ